MDFLHGVFYFILFFFPLHIWGELRSFGFATEFHSGAKNYKVPMVRDGTLVGQGHQHNLHSGGKEP